MKKLNILLAIRLALTLAFILLFVFMPLSAIENSSLCWYHTLTGKLCPGCGITRGLWQIVHFNFAKAYNLNLVFTLLFYPGFILSFLNELYILIYRLITKNNKLSVLEYYLSGKFTEVAK